VVRYAHRDKRKGLDLMRGLPVAALVLLLSRVVLAQTPAPSVTTRPADTPSATPPAAASPAPDGIGRDDYIAKARDAAAKRAATRFDAMDANHDGVLTKSEIAAYRAAHSRKKKTDSEEEE
jgi:hypothetical protein